ncbi:hypothetical protein EVAR_66737_1 [Eumeta japonica]|uniref:Uncharacterized protein n=1 Tax=Eumeta variegata TaxID=151549 RepID=A0A4C1SFV2_EUMVA|nr:hypothetical protein EVAR_66737_1 [Eumeta japonica]
MLAVAINKAHTNNAKACTSGGASPHGALPAPPALRSPMCNGYNTWYYLQQTTKALLANAFVTAAGAHSTAMFTRDPPFGRGTCSLTMRTPLG